MPNGDPRGGNFYPTLTLMIFLYNVITGELFVSGCFSRKVSVSLQLKGWQLSCIAYDVNLHIFVYSLAPLIRKNFVCECILLGSLYSSSKEFKLISFRSYFNQWTSINQCYTQTILYYQLKVKKHYYRPFLIYLMISVHPGSNI